MNTSTRLIFAITLSIIVTSTAYAKGISKQLPHIFYINIPVTSPDPSVDVSWQVSAQYRLPRGEHTAPLPAVIILHSSSGVDSTGQFYASELNDAGIATLELDLWGSRGLQGGGDRPATPQETLPDVFAALHYLAQQPNIDAERIGVIGFSWGGVLSMLTATEQYMAMTGTELRFAGHVAHYPICWLYNNVPGFNFSGLTGAPVLIQTGELDDYDLPETCPNLVDYLAEVDRELVEVKVFEGAYHAWDRLEPTWVVFDPVSHLGDPLENKVTLSPNKEIAKKSRKNVVTFFKKLFELEDSADD